MREIKFRAWMSRHGGQMYKWEDMLTWHLDQLEPRNDGFVFMQNTGLKDKNGKEIYEGDIVKDENDNVDEIRCSSFEHNEGGYFSGFFINNDSPIENLSVIGNIYENIHLLEAK